jgi:hypothetical protein
MLDLYFLVGAAGSAAFIVSLLVNAVLPYNYKEKIYVRKRTDEVARNFVR